MRNDLHHAAALLAGLLLAADAVNAQPNAFWCGNRLIREGMAATDIVAYCGEPAATERVEEPIYAWTPGGDRAVVGVEITEHWTYDRGRGRFPARVTVRAGVAEAIELLSR